MGITGLKSVRKRHPEQNRKAKRHKKGGDGPNLNAARWPGRNRAVKKKHSAVARNGGKGAKKHNKYNRGSVAGPERVKWLSGQPTKGETERSRRNTRPGQKGRRNTWP